MKTLSCTLLLSTLCLQLSASCEASTSMLSEPDRALTMALTNFCKPMPYNVSHLRAHNTLLIALQENSKVLENQDRTLEAMTNAATGWAENVNSDIRSHALSLLAELVIIHYEPAYKPAAIAAVAGACDQDPFVYHGALRLFLELIRAGYASIFESAALAALEATPDSSWHLGHTVLSIFEELINMNYKQVFERATTIAIQDYCDLENNVHWEALHLLSVIVAKGHKPARAPALKAAIQGINVHCKIHDGVVLNPHSHFIRKEALGLFYALVKTGYKPALKPARRAAAKGARDGNSWVRFEAGLLRSLLERSRPNLPRRNLSKLD